MFLHGSSVVPRTLLTQFSSSKHTLSVLGIHPINAVKEEDVIIKMPTYVALNEKMCYSVYTNFLIIKESCKRST